VGSVFNQLRSWWSCDTNSTGGCINLYLQVGGGSASPLQEFFSNGDANLWLKSGQIMQGYWCGASGVDDPSCNGNSLRACSRWWREGRGVISRFSRIFRRFDLLFLHLLGVFGGVGPTVADLFFPLGGVLGADVSLGVAAASAQVRDCF